MFSPCRWPRCFEDCQIGRSRSVRGLTGFWLFTVLLGTAGSALAQTQTTPSQASTAQKSQAATLSPGDLNTEFSRVYIFVDRTTSLGHTHGIEGRLKSGQLIADGKSSGEIVFDMRAFQADTPTARKVFQIEKDLDAATKKKVNENMLGPEILDVKQFPEARLDSATLTPTGKTSNRKLPEFLLEGDFTLHKTTHRITAVCDLEQRDGWHHVRGTFKILQTDYGIKPYTKMLGAVGIQDELIIFGDLWLVPAP